MAMDFSALDQAAVRRFQRKTTVLSAASMFLDGYDITVIGIALPYLVTQWHISAALQGVVAASTVVGMLVGALIVGRLTDLFGRRRMYLFTLLCFIVFAALAAGSQNVWELIAFRFLLGLGLGADYPVSSTLLAEFSSTARRGRQLTTLVANWFFGSLVAYVMGIVFIPVGSTAWRWILLLGAVIAVVVAIMRRTIPESPRWLQERGRDADAREVLAQLTGNQTESAPPAAQHQTNGTEQAQQPHSRWSELFSRHLIRTTVFVCVFWFAYDVAFYGITAYNPTILSGLTNGSVLASRLGSALIALLGLIGAGIGVSLVDRWGRRPLIILSFSGLTASLIALAVEPNPAFAALVALFAFAELFSNMGPGVLDMLYPTELFPTRVRSAGTGLATAVSRVGSILGIVAFPQLMASWGLSRALWLFVAAGILGLVICIWLAPETRGRTLEEASGEAAPQRR
jgi:putative MFS transporter